MSAGKGPNIQQRNQYPRDYGDWGSVLAAPNAPNWPATALASRQAEGLEAGDVCYITATQMRAWCSSPGTVGGRNATWITGPVNFAFLNKAAQVTGTTPTVLGSVYLFINEVIRTSSRAYLGAPAGGSATIQLRGVTAGLLAGVTFVKAGAMGDALMTGPGDVQVPTSEWYQIELVGDTGLTTAIAEGLRLVK